MAKKRREPKVPVAEAADPVEVEVIDEDPAPESESESESEPVEEQDPQGGNGNGEDEAAAEDDGASVEVKTKGSPNAVRSAFRRLGGAPRRATAPPPPEMEDEEVAEDDYENEALELVAKLLLDPRNKVAVIRTYPRRVLGRNCAIQVDEYPCPTTIEQIERDVFERFGGESYNLMVHPNSPAGRHKILGAYPITHPTMKDPIFEDDEQQQQPEIYDPRGGQISDGTDPTAEPNDDPMAIAENMMKRKAKLLNQQVNLKTAERAVKSMEEEEKTGARQGDPVIRAMEERFDRQLAEVKQLLMQQAQQARPPIQDNTLLVELMRGNQAQFAAMMQAMQASQASTMQAMAQLNQGSKRGESVDEQLDRLVKMKEAFGNDDSRVRRLEQMAFDALTDKLAGGGGEGDSADDDPIKFGIKQLTPVLKQYLDKQGNKEPAVSQEELRRIHDEAAQKAGKELAAQWEREGKLVRVPMPGSRPPQKQPPVQQGPVVQEAHEQEDDMPLPSRPGAPDYDRAKAVDFALSTIIDDIEKGCPQDSYAVGDCLDFLDPEILGKVLEIATGADLEGLMRPYADPTKVDFIKEAGKDPNVKSHLTRIVVTVQDVYRRKLAKEKVAVQPQKP